MVHLDLAANHYHLFRCVGCQGLFDEKIARRLSQSPRFGRAVQQVEVGKVGLIEMINQPTFEIESEELTCGWRGSGPFRRHRRRWSSLLMRRSRWPC